MYRWVLFSYYPNVLKREPIIPRSKKFDAEEASSRSEGAKREFERVQKEQDCLSSGLSTLRSTANHMMQLSSQNNNLYDRSRRMIEESKKLAIEAEHMRNSAREVLLLLSDCYDLPRNSLQDLAPAVPTIEQANQVTIALDCYDLPGNSLQDLSPAVPKIEQANQVTRVLDCYDFPISGSYGTGAPVL